MVHYLYRNGAEIGMPHQIVNAIFTLITFVSLAILHRRSKWVLESHFVFIFDNCHFYVVPCAVYFLVVVARCGCLI